MSGFQPTSTVGPQFPSAETAISTLLFLLSRYALEPDLQCVGCIYRHLAVVNHHPELQATMIQRISARLLGDWKRQLEVQQLLFENLH